MDGGLVAVMWLELPAVFWSLPLTRALTGQPMRRFWQCVTAGTYRIETCRSDL